jgi:hypothetical protein
MTSAYLEEYFPEEEENEKNERYAIAKAKMEEETKEARSLKHRILRRFHDEFDKFKPKGSLKDYRYKRQIELFVLVSVSTNTMIAGKQIDQQMKHLREKLELCINALGSENVAIDDKHVSVIVHRRGECGDFGHTVFMNVYLCSKIEETPDGANNFFDL